jgi:hypothetical protein
VLLALPLPDFVDLTTKIVTVTSIGRPDAVVFDYVTTPAHWPNWHPSSLSVSGATDHSLSVGEQVTEEFRVAGRRGRVVWTVAVRDRPSRWVILGTIDGKSAGTVIYSLMPLTSGTRFEREFAYRAPSLWFAALNVLFVRTRIQQESDEAVARLKKTLEAMSPTGTRWTKDRRSRMKRVLEPEGTWRDPMQIVAFLQAASQYCLATRALYAALHKAVPKSMLDSKYEFWGG